MVLRWRSLLIAAIVSLIAGDAASAEPPPPDSIDAGDAPDPATAAANRHVADNLSAITARNAAALAAHAKVEAGVAAENAARQSAYAAQMAAWQADADEKRRAFADWEMANRDRRAAKVRPSPKPARRPASETYESGRDLSGARADVKICRVKYKEAATGTLIGRHGTRICLTRAEWAERELDAREKVIGMTAPTGGMCRVPPC